MHPDLLSRSEPVRSTRRMGRHSARRIAAACAVLEHPHPRRAGALTYGCPRRARRLQVGAAAGRGRWSWHGQRGGARRRQSAREGWLFGCIQRAHGPPGLKLGTLIVCDIGGNCIRDPPERRSRQDHVRPDHVGKRKEYQTKPNAPSRQPPPIRPPRQLQHRSSHA